MSKERDWAALPPPLESTNWTTTTHYHRFVMELVQWHKDYSPGEDELDRACMVALKVYILYILNLWKLFFLILFLGEVISWWFKIINFFIKIINGGFFLQWKMKVDKIGSILLYRILTAEGRSWKYVIQCCYVKVICFSHLLNVVQ